VRTDRWLASH